MQTWLFVALSLVCLDSARVWLSCQAIIGISVRAGLYWVFANPVTFLIPKFLLLNFPYAVLQFNTAHFGFITTHLYSDNLSFQELIGLMSHERTIMLWFHY